MGSDPQVIAADDLPFGDSKAERISPYLLPASIGSGMTLTRLANSSNCSSSPLKNSRHGEVS